jgi:excisionase family DNA binding protein
MKTYKDKRWVAERYGCSEHTVSAWVKGKYIPYIRCGRMVRFDEGALDDWDQGRAVVGRTKMPAVGLEDREI